MVAHVDEDFKMMMMEMGKAHHDLETIDGRQISFRDDANEEFLYIYHHHLEELLHVVIFFKRTQQHSKNKCLL